MAWCNIIAASMPARARRCARHQYFRDAPTKCSAFYTEDIEPGASRRLDITSSPLSAQAAHQQDVPHSSVFATPHAISSSIFRCYISRQPFRDVTPRKHRHFITALALLCWQSDFGEHDAFKLHSLRRRPMRQLAFTRMTLLRRFLAAIARIIAIFDIARRGDCLQGNGFAGLYQHFACMPPPP